jgi:serine-type D-Ala-D-Ala carboxypeptidase/endopeptidase (penicillin-binding protein 4)
MDVTRRGLLAGLLAGVAGPALAEGAVTHSLRPMARPLGGGAVPAKAPVALGSASGVVTAAKLGGVTGFYVAEVATGRVLEQENAGALVPPASVIKSMTALYALDRLGPAHRFRTEVRALGVMRQGRLEGDLVLVGGGDPMLDSDELGDLVASLAAAGLREVSGRFLAYAGALPEFDRITEDQPVQVGYNPGLSGLCLNFNRVNFEWTKGGASVAMNARGERYVPDVRMARMKVVERDSPVFAYRMAPGVEDWSVARVALRKPGSRWLPVRQVALYVAEVFSALCAAQGIKLKPPEVVRDLPASGQVLAGHDSPELTDILRQMLRFSTNITAEAVGLAASGAPSRGASASAMVDWARAELGPLAHLGDHSGLGPLSRVTPEGMARALMAGDRRLNLRPVLRKIPMRDDKGNPIENHPVKVVGKSGTLNFVSGLAGFLQPPGGRDLCFAIFSADVPRREAVPVAEREDPAGSDAWVGRAHRMQAQLIRRWAEMV